MKELDRVKVKGQTFKIFKSPRKNKQLLAISLDEKIKVHFGAPNMPEFPGTKRGDNYCARSSGIKGTDNIKSANFWSRFYLWNCKGKKSMSRRPVL